MSGTEFDSLHSAIRQAGVVLMDLFGRQLERTFKTTNADFRTQADVAAEEIIIAAIEKEFPDYNIVAEEHGNMDRGSAYSFVIDPLDGTNNFVLGIPAFVTNVALLQVDGTVHGVVHHPVTGDTYWASRGTGAYLNGERIAVNAVEDIEKSTVSYYCNYTTPPERTASFKSTLLRLGIQRSLDLWAPGFCFCALASGRLEAVINDGTELYDYAAGRLIAIEAGARVSSLSGATGLGEQHDEFILSNGTAIHDFLLERVTRPLMDVGREAAEPLNP